MIGFLIDPGDQSLNGRERNELYRNLGRSPLAFADAGYLARCDRIEDGRGAVAADFDGDGDLDLAIQSFGRQVVLLVNDGHEAGHWLRVKLRGSRSNRDAIGARLVVEAGGLRLTREVTSTAGYLSGQSLVVHFGLGDAKRIDRLEVRWPGGGTTVLEDLPADQRLELVEDQ